MRSPWLAGWILIIGTNLVIAAGVIHNRTGDSDAVLVLTERELALPGFRGRDENSGLALRLRSQLREFELDRDKLREVGFNVETPPSDPRAKMSYRRTLPHRAFVVLEIEGDSWTRWITKREADVREVEAQRASGKATQDQLENAVEYLERDRVKASRLFVVDVGRNARALRRAYADRQRYTVVPGVVRLSLRSKEKGPDKLYGWVSKILVRQIHVPHSLRPVIIEAMTERRQRDARRNNREWQGTPRKPELPNETWQPTFQATLAFGRRLEPILETVALLDSETAP